MQQGRTLLKLPRAHMDERPTSMVALIQTFGEATQHSGASTPKDRNLRKPKAMPHLRAVSGCLWEGPRVFPESDRWAPTSAPRCV